MVHGRMRSCPMTVHHLLTSHRHKPRWLGLGYSWSTTRERGEALIIKRSVLSRQVKQRSVMFKSPSGSGLFLSPLLNITPPDTRLHIPPFTLSFCTTPEYHGFPNRAYIPEFIQSGLSPATTQPQCRTIYTTTTSAPANNLPLDTSPRSSLRDRISSAATPSVNVSTSTPRTMNTTTTPSLLLLSQS